MKPSEMRELSIEELKEKETELAQELFNLRFQRAANQLENKMKIGITRREIARVKTIIHEIERSAGNE
ncbi:MAG: 50S ribosomal protein L29 [Deltaproteobacteria bacterium]|nr:50S ribosomal protein L29 [Candidatus Zymogenaceae bacterium]